MKKITKISHKYKYNINQEINEEQILLGADEHDCLTGTLTSSARRLG
jgi:hypothetical protein